jgi:hypothetical protein
MALIRDGAARTLLAAGRGAIILIFYLCGHLILTANIRAQGVIIDQHNDQANPRDLAYWTLGVMTPVGQEFVPTLNAMDFVDAAFTTREGGFDTITMQVLIHESTITGPVVGASAMDTFSASAFFGGVHRFEFPSTVPLVAGNMYVLDFVQQLPVGNFIGTDPSMAYPGGQMIRGGAPFDGFDLWFREGVMVPEPSTSLLALVGILLLFTFKRTGPPANRMAAIVIKSPAGSSAWRCG